MRKSRELCSGCYDEIYWDRGEKKCWKFKTAKVVKLKRVPINQVPPYTQDPEPRMDCFTQSGYAFLAPTSKIAVTHAKVRLQQQLGDVIGVLKIGVGGNKDNYHIKVAVSEGVEHKIPKSIDGILVVVEVTSSSWITQVGAKGASA